MNNNLENNLENKNNNSFYIICGIVSSIVLYFNNNDDNINELLQHLDHLKHIHNDSLLDLDDSKYFINPTDNLLNHPISPTDSDSTVRNLIMKFFLS